MPANRPVAIQIDDEIRARVKRLADARQRTPHGLIREAIIQYVDREEKRETSRLATLKAWDDKRSSGLFVTSEEADAWLARLEQGEDAEPPEFHR